VLAGKKAGPAAAADGSGDKGLFEQHALGGQLIHIGRPELGETRAAHSVVRLVVQIKQDEVRTRIRSMTGRAAQERKKHNYNQD
jgi:hypothetical protein